MYKKGYTIDAVESEQDASFNKELDQKFKEEHKLSLCLITWHLKVKNQLLAIESFSSQKKLYPWS